MYLIIPCKHLSVHSEFCLLFGRIGCSVLKNVLKKKRLEGETHFGSSRLQEFPCLLKSVRVLQSVWLLAPADPFSKVTKTELEEHVFMETLINFSSGDQSLCVTELSNTICPEALSSEFQSQSHILRDLPFSSYLVCGGVSLGLNPVWLHERSMPGFLCQGL